MAIVHPRNHHLSHPTTSYGYPSPFPSLGYMIFVHSHKLLIMCGMLPAFSTGLSVPDGMEAHNYCVIASNTVTGICMKPRRMITFCTTLGGENVVPVPATYTSISGTLSTTNLIMANWPNTMWQSVLDRAIQVLASGLFGLHFSSASATIDRK
ncbi:hypothetical protein KIN20_014656 [Parelaphostrongylus tenuis]|uniref:Uncharacterized protein n=1 Tax=Parelaphostrongylus tenuis TaxID=148309 RepID=A0AAD5MXL6_PARTN|nr:hypothetical protein KIN20_014656 [Parelaphostrongylus tenuis]